MNSILKILAESWFGNDDAKSAPPIIKQAIERIVDKLNKPPSPIMLQDEFDKLGSLRKSILTCNVIGCKEMVCTHGMLCVAHSIISDAWYKENFETIKTTEGHAIRPKRTEK